MEAAEWIFSQKMAGNEGRSVYTLMLNKEGGIEADLNVSVLKPYENKVHHVLRPANVRTRKYPRAFFSSYQI